MKNNMLYKSLISSILVLLAFSTLLYLVAGSPEATPWSSLGAIIMGIFKMIQWLIAMTMALVICLVVLFAIFLGAVALFDRKAAASMFQNLMASLPSWIPLCGEGCCSSSAQAEAAEERYNALRTELKEVHAYVHTTQKLLTDKIDQLTVRIEKLEVMSTDMASQEKLEDMSHDIQNTVDSLSSIQNVVTVMQSSVEQTANQLEAISPESILGDLPQRVQSLETFEKKQGAIKIPEPVDITPLQDELTQVKETADRALEVATESASISASMNQQDILGDLPQRVQSLETFEKEQGAIKIPEPIDITPLQDELTQVKETANKALEVATESASISASMNQQDILGDLPQRVQSLETFEKEQGAIKIPEPIDITPLQDELTQVKETADKALEVATESASISASMNQQDILGDLPQRVQSLETFEKEQGAIKIPEPIDITPLQDELTQVKKTADKALEVATESATISTFVDQQEKCSEEHHIFSFFDDPADKEKLSKLVASTLDRDMSYNQVLNFITKEFGGEKGKIISSRPLLTKDYIRQCRKNN